MRAVVRSAYRLYTEPLEGGVPCLYADKYGWITTAYGNLVDPMQIAMGLPFVHPDGRLARGDEIKAAWLAVKNDPKAAGFGWRYAATLTDLRLPPEAMLQCLYVKLDSNDARLRERIPDFEELGACAQLALHSLAWACGPNFHFPALLAGIVARDFNRAAVEIHIDESGPDHILGTPDDNFGLHARNVANRILMRNAQRVLDYELDPDTLEWVRDLAVADLPTAPDLPNPPSSEPVLEDDGGASREQATFDAVDELAKNRGEEP